MKGPQVDEVNKIADLIASRFIQRRDVKAVQRGSAYMPVTDNGKANGARVGWKRQDLVQHIEGRKSYGHYLVGTDGKCKLFAFDIDLSKWSEASGRPQPTWLPIDADGMTVDVQPKPLQPRDAWNHPKAPEELRRFLVAQMRGISDMLASIIADTIGVPVAVTYSGNKGLHVYGFTGAAPAHDVRGAAMEVIKFAGCFESLRGKNFFAHKDSSPRTGHGCIEVEVFPKQDDLDGKDLGNLMRLPMGIHGKSNQRAYFLTLNSHVDELKEADPILAMEGGSPWL